MGTYLRQKRQGNKTVITALSQQRYRQANANGADCLPEPSWHKIGFAMCQRDKDALSK
jgi:hypothetical protein